jgi:hypothetical protein
MTSFSLIGGYRRFGIAFCHHFFSIPHMETVFPSETSVSAYMITRCPEDQNLKNQKVSSNKNSEIWKCFAMRLLSLTARSWMWQWLYSTGCSGRQVTVSDFLSNCGAVELQLLGSHPVPENATQCSEQANSTNYILLNLTNKRC